MKGIRESGVRATSDFSSGWGESRILLREQMGSGLYGCESRRPLHKDEKNTEDSDIDIVVEVERPTIGIFGFKGLDIII